MSSLPRSFRVRQVSDLLSASKPEWLIDGIIPAKSLSVIYGPPGAGKTFVALGMALSISSGAPWLGRDVRRGPVIYCTPEGLSGLAQRYLAWCAHHKGEESDFGYVVEAPQFSDPREVDALAASIKERYSAPAAIFVDTLARHMTGGDENSAQHMGEFVTGVERLCRALGCAGILLHHTGKNTRNERGSTALRGAADTMISVAGQSGRLTIACEKQKDAEPFERISARLQTVDIGDGMASCTCVLATGTFQGGHKLDNKKEKILLALHRAGDSGLRVSQLILSTGLAEPTFHRHRNALVSLGLIEQGGDGYRLTAEGQTSASALISLSKDCRNSDSARSLSSLSHPVRGEGEGKEASA